MITQNNTDSFFQTRVIVDEAQSIFAEFDRETAAARARAEERLRALGMSGVTLTVPPVPSASVAPIIALPETPAELPQIETMQTLTITDLPALPVPALPVPAVSAPFPDALPEPETSETQAEGDNLAAPVVESLTPETPKRVRDWSKPRPNQCLGFGGESCGNPCAKERCQACATKHSNAERKARKQDTAPQGVAQSSAAAPTAAPAPAAPSIWKKNLCIGTEGQPCGAACMGERCKACSNRHRAALHTAAGVHMSVKLPVEVPVAPSANVQAPVQETSENSPISPVSAVTEETTPELTPAASLNVQDSVQIQGPPVITTTPLTLSARQIQTDIPRARSRGINTRRARDQGWFMIALVTDKNYQDIEPVFTRELPEEADYIETCILRGQDWYSGETKIGRSQNLPFVRAAGETREAIHA